MFSRRWEKRIIGLFISSVISFLVYFLKPVFAGFGRVAICAKGLTVRDFGFSAILLWFYVVKVSM